MSDTTGTPKKAAKKPAAAPAVTPDEDLLMQQAQEEAEAKAAGGSVETPIEEAPALASNLGKLEVLRKLWLHTHVGEPMPSDERLLELEDSLLAGASAPSPAVPDAPDDLMADLPPAVAAILAGQAQQQAALTQALEMLAEKVAGQRGTEVQVSLGSGGESAEKLLKQLVGTVEDGGDGEEPLEHPVTYISKGSHFKAIYKPRYRGVGPTGEQFFTTGIAADFAPHGQWTTKNREMAEWLETRPGFGTDFWRQGAEPFSAPDPSTILEQIMDAMLALDDARLAELEAEERASHKRPLVLKQLQAARNRVQGFSAGTPA